MGRVCGREEGGRRKGEVMRDPGHWLGPPPHYKDPAATSPRAGGEGGLLCLRAVLPTWQGHLPRVLTRDMAAAVPGAGTRGPGCHPNSIPSSLSFLIPRPSFRSWNTRTMHGAGVPTEATAMCSPGGQGGRSSTQQVLNHCSAWWPTTWRSWETHPVAAQGEGRHALPSPSDSPPKWGGRELLSEQSRREAFAPGDNATQRTPPRRFSSPRVEKGHQPSTSRSPGMGDMLAATGTCRCLSQGHSSVMSVPQGTCVCDTPDLTYVRIHDGPTFNIQRLRGAWEA